MFAVISCTLFILAYVCEEEYRPDDDRDGYIRAEQEIANNQKEDNGGKAVTPGAPDCQTPGGPDCVTPGGDPGLYKAPSLNADREAPQK